MEAVQLDEYDRREPIYIEYRDPDGDFVVKYRASRGYYVEGDGADRAPSFENLDDAIEHGELSVMSMGNEIDENYHDSNLETRKITNKLHELMDDQVLDPRAVADAALIYMSEADVADMARTNELYDGEDDFDSEIDEEIKSGTPGGRPFIDLSGPDGNAFVMMGLAKSYAEQLRLDGNAIVHEMREGDYENLLAVFDKYFGDYVDLYRGDADDVEESIDDNMFPENEDDVSTCECGSDDISKWTDDQGRKNVACNECGDEWMY